MTGLRSAISLLPVRNGRCGVAIAMANDRVRGIWHRIHFFISNNRAATVGWALSAIGLSLASAPTQLSESIRLGLGLLALAVSLYFFWEKVVVWRRSYTTLEPVFPPLGFREKVAAEGLALVEIDNSVAVTSDGVNEALWYSQNAIDLDSRRYKLPKPIDEFYRVIFRELPTKLHTTNDAKVRLVTQMHRRQLGSSAPIRLQRTDYYSGLATNEAAPYVLYSPSHGELFRGSDHFFRDGELLPLEQSSASNHIGVTTLVLTRDLRLAYQLQGRNMIDSNKHAASGSGSLDWEDVKRFETLFGRTPHFEDLVRFGMEREAIEEIGVVEDRSRMKTWLTGYARLIHRGGKPDFFGLTVVDQDSAELRIRKDEERRVKRIKYLELDNLDGKYVVQRLKAFLSERELHRDIGISFILSLRLAVDRLSAEGEWFLEDAFGELEGAPCRVGG